MLAAAAAAAAPAAAPDLAPAAAAAAAAAVWKCMEMAYPPSILGVLPFLMSS